MLPTLRDGDVLWVRYAAPRRSGRVAVVRLPARAPGGGVDPHGPGVVAVKRLGARERTEAGAAWWVERDNPAEGVDSWQVGAVPEHDVWGIAVARLWPAPRRLARRRPAP